MRSSAIKPSRLFKFFPMVTNRFFSFSSYFSSSSSSLHILSNSPTSIFSFYKYSLLLSHFFSQTDSSLSKFLIQNSLPLPNSLIFFMAPKSKTKKTSYMFSSDAFNLTCWNEVVRLNESPPLTYKPQDHLSEGARVGSISFSNFSHFLFFLLSSILICFWTCICLGFAVGWV